jgi:DeoR family glycerol-3-phosphate regulon repressor
LFLTIGTTTEAVARALLAHRDLLVVTNNLNIANILVANPQIEVVVAGGTLRRTDGGLVGPTAVRLIEQFKVDLAVMGCSALDQDGDMLDFDSAEVAVSQTIIAQARQRVLVADHSKIGRKAPIRVAPLSQMAKLYTEAPLPAPLAAKCGAWGTQIVVAPPLA